MLLSLKLHLRKLTVTALVIRWALNISSFLFYFQLSLVLILAMVLKRLYRLKSPTSRLDLVTLLPTRRTTILLTTRILRTWTRWPTPVMTMRLSWRTGIWRWPARPTESGPPGHPRAVSIPADNFPFFGGHMTFLGPLVPLFWISGDVSSGFQSQNGFCLIHFFLRRRM